MNFCVLNSSSFGEERAALLFGLAVVILFSVLFLVLSLLLCNRHISPEFWNTSLQYELVGKYPYMLSIMLHFSFGSETGIYGHKLYLFSFPLHISVISLRLIDIHWFAYRNMEK